MKENMMGLGGLKIRWRRRSSDKQNEPTDQKHHSQFRVGMLGGPHHPKVAKEEFQRRGSLRRINSTRYNQERNATTSGDQQPANQPPQAIAIPEDISIRISRLYVRGRVGRQKRREEEEGMEGGNYMYAYSDTVRRPRERKTKQQEEHSVKIINTHPGASSPPPSYGKCVELGLFDVPCS